MLAATQLGYGGHVVARLALINVPFRSHIEAMMRLAVVLRHQGHELIVWAPEAWRPSVEELGARFELSSPEMPRPPASRLAAEFAARTELEAERLIPQLHAHDVDAVIRDSQTPWALVAAQYLGIPRIVSHPMFPMPDVELGDTGRSDPEGGRPNAAERESFERSWLSISRRWGVELADVRGLHHATAEPTLTFTTEEIIGDQALPSAWRCIGPLLSPPPPRRPKRSPPLVYACFGTAQNRRTELFRIVIAALARQPVELLISAGGRSFVPRELAPVPSNVVVSEFLPTREVLAAASVHITHGGCNSVHESLLAGVPMVCLPQAFDQIPLSTRVAELGVGVIAEEDPGAVRDAVLKLLGDGQTHGRLAALSGRLQRYDGEGRVSAAIAACM
jgi:MGT family glycosyltransferase